MLHPELPQNIEAERATLGSIIQNRDAIVSVASWLTPEMFYLERNAQIYAAMLHLFEQRTPPDFRLVCDELKRRDQLERAGGILYLSDLTDAVPTSYHIEYYAKEVSRCAALRALITAGGKIAAMGYNEADDERAYGSAYQAIAELTMKRPSGGLVSSPEAADREYARMARADAGQMPTGGARTGYRDIDEMFQGLNDTDLIIVAARPSVGKTSLLMGLAHGVAEHNPDRDVQIFSLEMSEEQLRYRRLSMLSRIDSSRIRTLRFSEAERGPYMDALMRMSEMPVYVDDKADASVAYIRAAAARHQAQHGRKLVIFVDYIQLMAGKETENRVQEVSAISRGLKLLAKELQCPVIALSQLSRKLEERQSKIPLLSDLRESGSIEQDADIVMFIYRDELYDKDSDRKGIAELHIAKHRNGPIGVIPMRFDVATTTFSDLTGRTPEGY